MLPGFGGWFSFTHHITPGQCIINNAQDKTRDKLSALSLIKDGFTDTVKNTAGFLAL